jgi:hypothetical protein
MLQRASGRPVYFIHRALRGEVVRIWLWAYPGTHGASWPGGAVPKPVMMWVAYAGGVHLGLVAVVVSDYDAAIGFSWACLASSWWRTPHPGPMMEAANGG